MASRFYGETMSKFFEADLRESLVLQLLKFKFLYVLINISIEHKFSGELKVKNSLRTQRLT